MFESARIKLTAWYLLIIMVISIVFSLVIYNGIDREFNRFERAERIRIQQQLEFGMPQDPRAPNALMIAQARERLLITLILVNAGILVLSGVAGYFLAGRTLLPIEEMIEEQNRFITDSSHELRTPLTSLKTSIEVNLRDKSLNLEKSKALLRSNLEEVNSLHSLSDELISLAQFQKAKGNIMFEKLNLSEVALGALHTIEPMAKQKGIKLTHDLEEVSLEGDRKNITELFMILLDNAVKYSPKGAAVDIQGKKTDGHVQIRISDTGEGIDEKDLEYIFDRFFRAERSRTKDVGGYGLGLSIAKKIIESHNGSVSVESKKGKGTTFTIMLPVKQPGHFLS